VLTLSSGAVWWRLQIWVCKYYEKAASQISQRLNMELSLRIAFVFCFGVEGYLNSYWSVITFFRHSLLQVGLVWASICLKPMQVSTVTLRLQNPSTHPTTNHASATESLTFFHASSRLLATAKKTTATSDKSFPLIAPVTKA
jgi:hypothetical protein